MRPLLVFLTLPLTLITFGLFLLVINALVLMLVAKLVNGFLSERLLDGLLGQHLHVAAQPGAGRLRAGRHARVHHRNRPQGRIDLSCEESVVPAAIMAVSFVPSPLRG